MAKLEAFPRGRGGTSGWRTGRVRSRRGGRFLSETEDRRRAEAVFIGEDPRERFFPGGEAVGKMLAMNGRPFPVVGAW